MRKLIAGLIATMFFVAACAGPVARSGSAGTPTVSAQGTQGSKATKRPSQPTATATLSSAPNPTSSGSGSGPNTLDACLHYSGHVYEVCTAYIANSSLAVLLPYYQYAHGSNDALARYVTYRLGSRYTGQANRLIKARVASWPSGDREVSVPYIRIVSVHSSLVTNTATLVTRESWRVTNQNGKVIYQETNQRHVVTMHRVPSYLLHKWVVSNLR